ncbi:MAG: hypothetical protein IKO15_05090 [Clostridiales bacterium]|nr:hypothetical protein [Clostridiales bacterium]
MKRYIKSAAMILTASMLLAACGSAPETSESHKGGAIRPVDSFYTDEVKEYTDEGIKEDVINTISSADGLCVIKAMPSYYDVTLDYEKGDRGSVGRAYGTLIREELPGFIETMEPYLFENIRVAYNSNYSAEVIEKRSAVLLDSMRPEYREEICGLAEGISNGAHGIVEDGIFSYEEAILIQMIPDALRPTCCSALSLWGSKTVTGDRITLRNLEWNLGSGNQMGKINAVTHMKNGSRSITAISILGLLDIISGINDDGVFAAILDVGSVQKEAYIYEGKKCYTMELRYALEEFSTARELGEFMVGESGDFTWCHNLIISDKNDSFCAEDCVSQVAEKGLGRSVLRDCNTPLISGISWDSADSLCVVNSYASEGNQDGFTGSQSNVIRFFKYNKWVQEKDKFSTKDVKELITQEVVAQFDVVNCHSGGSAQLILVDYHTGTVQVAFAGEAGVTDKPDFIEVDTFIV